MERLLTRIATFGRDDRGATVIEYCFIACFMSIAIVAGATLTGQQVLAFFQSLAATP